MKKILALLLFVAVVSIGAASSAEDLRQFSANSSLTGGIPVSITVVGTGSEEGGAGAAMSGALAHSARLDSELFGAGGVDEKLRQAGKGSPLALSADAYDLLKRAALLSSQTGGFYDVAAPSSAGNFTQRDYRRISFDDANSSVSFKSDGMALDLRRISLGYIVDLIMGDLTKAGFTNAMVQVGPVSRNIGHDIFTPWNLMIDLGGGEASQYAHRARSYNLRNVASATITPDGLGRDLVDGKNKKAVSNNGIRSVTVLSGDATTATAFALAAYAVGSGNAMKYVIDHPAIKGILVMNDGQIVASPELGISSPNLTNRWPVSEGKDLGPDNMKQKEKEEASDQ
jgi:thiamine biosynthesis lipoprotein ApbE